MKTVSFHQSPIMLKRTMYLLEHTFGVGSRAENSLFFILTALAAMEGFNAVVSCLLCFRTSSTALESCSNAGRSLHMVKLQAERRLLYRGRHHHQESSLWRYPTFLLKFDSRQTESSCSGQATSSYTTRQYWISWGMEMEKS